jgi:hypothetical protein
MCPTRPLYLLQTTCEDFQDMTSPYHQITHAGLNALVQEYFVHFKEIVLAVSRLVVSFLGHRVSPMLPQTVHSQE